MATCGASIQYAGVPRHVCDQPAGHKGPHSDGPLTWTCSAAPIPPTSGGR